MNDIAEKPHSDRGTAINNVRNRATKARARIKWIVVFLLVSILGVAGIDLLEMSINRANQFKEKLSEIRASMTPVSFAFRNPEGDLRKKFAVLIDQQIGPLNKLGDEPKISAKPQFDEINQQLDITLDQYRKAAEIFEKLQTTNQPAKGTNWVQLASTLITEIGAVVFALFFVQMALSFIRYYAQLAELFDAQADALLYASGDDEQAARFLERFSPTVEFTKTPLTLYERAFDAAKELVIAASKKGE